MQASRVISEATSSFHSHSNSSNLAEIAARVVEEFKAENETDEEFYVNNENDEEQGGEDDDDDDEEFEFSFVKQSEFSPISADEIFDNGQIRPIYPIFNKDFGDLMQSNAKSNSIPEEGSRTPPASIRLPLRKLFMEEEREGNTSSCSSSEADDLEAIPAGTYCVWRPKPAEEEESGGCKKSKSTGSSKRWRFRDLLHRSYSDGKDTFVFLTPSLKKKEEKAEKTTTKSDVPKVAGKMKVPVAGEGNPAVHYSKSGSDKRKTYLPYRQDLVGFFANMNGMSRNVHPF